MTTREDFPLWAQDTARYGDTDRQGHLNNAVFGTYLETGRTSFLAARGAPLAPAGHDFVIVRLEVDFRREMHWGGPVEIGTVVRSLGRTSFRLGQAIFQDGHCTATAESVLVLMNDETRAATPLPDTLRARLTEYMRP
jgi:acyl-CoA thioester hydrolase